MKKLNSFNLLALVLIICLVFAGQVFAKEPAPGYTTVELAAMPSPCDPITETDLFVTQPQSDSVKPAGPAPIPFRVLYPNEAGRCVTFGGDGGE